MTEVRVVFLLLDHLYFLGVILGVRVVIEASIGGLAHPVVSGLQLVLVVHVVVLFCLLYTSPSPRDLSTSRMPSSA